MKIDRVRTSASFECNVFADTECFGCGLCDWARMEKQYCDDFMMDHDEYGLLGARMNKGDSNGVPKEC